MTGHYPQGWVKTLIYYSVATTAGIFFPTYSYLTGADWSRRFGEHLLVEKGAWQTRIPHLYIYSQADFVTDYTYVEERMEIQRQQGTPVSSLRLEDSQHVAHLLKYKQEYTEEVLKFTGDKSQAAA